jgi:hypothetical protein
MSIILVHLSEAERQAISRLPALEQLIAKMTQQAAKQKKEIESHKDILSPTKAGKLCGCNPETIRKAAVIGILPAIPVAKTRGGKPGILIAREDALAWLLKGKPLK